MLYYCGIGSRDTPAMVLALMTRIAIHLAKKGYILRSGGAKGADSAFEKGAGAKEIFYARDALPWTYEEVQKHLPKGYTWKGMRDYVQNLLARDMMQVLGRNGDEPVEFVICWTPTDKLGGTGYAIRYALAHNIPVYNLNNKQEWIAFKEKYLS